MGNNGQQGQNEDEQLLWALAEAQAAYYTEPEISADADGVNTEQAHRPEKPAAYAAAKTEEAQPGGKVSEHARPQERTEVRAYDWDEKFEVLKQYFGYDSFRGGQEQLIDSILSGRDTLGIMPTGSGKSLCFQVPALMFPGITLVISPLISLMKDQVSSLNQAGVHAAYLNSSLTPGQYTKALRYAAEGRYPIIYVAPERLTTESFLAFARQAEISMVAVDEAHCISQWGQDFRPSYLKIVEFIRMLPKRPVISAFTATATREVRDDVVRILELDNPTIVTTGFDRSNLYFAVETPKDRYEAVRSYIAAHPDKGGVVYCLTRKQVDEVTERLIRDGFSVTKYHAGLSDEERRRNQDDFIYDRIPVIVATNAFGMGIDRSDVRFVLHYGMPKNLEAYYQEAGRAGRDGEPAECVLYYSGKDVITNQFFIEQNRDTDALDPEARALIQERDRERLKRMTFYCFTNDCLRAYILRYFGEYGSDYCGNCANCLTKFEETDVTEIAAAMAGCVAASGQRYGLNVIFETLRGANTVKVRNYRMQQNPYYGTCAKTPAHRLRQVLNYLQMNDYLEVTADTYAVVRMKEKAQELLDGSARIVMKLPKEQPKIAADTGRRKRGTKDASQFGTAEESLFAQLRALRRTIAVEERVAPYMVFTDRSLTDMCLKRPATKAEMLTVSGVGAFKYEKYGARFLAAIAAARK